MTRRQRDDLRFVLILMFCMLSMAVSIKGEDLPEHGERAAVSERPT